MIDSHCHLNFPSLSNDINDIITRCKKNGIKKLLTINTNPKDFQDIFSPKGINVDVKVTEKGHPVNDIQGCFDGVVGHIVGTVYPEGHPKAGKMKTPGLDKRRYEWKQEVADKIYFLHHNPTTRDYTFLGTATANDLAEKYVQDAVDML